MTLKNNPPQCSTCKCTVEKSGRCSPCNKEYQRQYKINNPDKVRLALQNHYKNNSDRIKKRVRNKALENPNKTKKKSAEYYQKNKEKRREKINAWRDKNQDRVKQIHRISCLNRVARKKNAPGRHTIHDIRNMYDQQLGKCNACPCSIMEAYHVDHITPLSRGGTNWPDNLQLLCPPCNMQKHTKTMEEFMEMRKTIRMI